MKVFISWSGDPSRQLADALRDWLPDIIQDLEPWVSFEDIAKGKHWNEEISSTLDKVHQGIICVTHENMHSPWLNFEAGALAKRLSGSDGGQVRPVLLNVRPADVTGPLASFQATEITSKDDVLRLALSLDRPRLDGRAPLGEERLRRYLEAHWPSLQERLDEIIRNLAAESNARSAAPKKPERDGSDMLAELLETVRRLERRADRALFSNPMTLGGSTRLAGSVPQISGINDINVSSLSDLNSQIVPRDRDIFRLPGITITPGKYIMTVDKDGQPNFQLKTSEESGEGDAEE